MAGLAWARLAVDISGWWPVITGVLALASFRRARLFSVYAVILFGFSLGWWRGGIFMSEVRFLDSIAREKVTVVGRSLNDSMYDERGALSFDIGSLSLVTPEGNKDIVGKIGVSGYGEKMVYRGDQVQVSGKFSPGRGSYVGWMSYAL